MRLIERFESKINKIENGCWNWIGEIHPKGKHGVFRIGMQMISAYRLSYELYKGEIFEKLFVCHSCDNRSCVNPAHLWLGTQKENMADAALKGRMHQGEASKQSILKEINVIEIVKLYSTGDYSQQQLADMFGVKHTTIHQIISGKAWKHIIVDRTFRKGRGSIGDKNGTRLHPELVVRGEKHPATKISDDIVKEIRNLSTKFSQRKLANMFGISQTQIGRIIREEARK